MPPTIPPRLFSGFRNKIPASFGKGFWTAAGAGLFSLLIVVGIGVYHVGKQGLAHMAAIVAADIREPLQQQTDTLKYRLSAVETEQDLERRAKEETDPKFASAYKRLKHELKGAKKSGESTVVASIRHVQHSRNVDPDSMTLARK